MKDKKKGVIIRSIIPTFLGIVTAIVTITSFLCEIEYVTYEVSTYANPNIIDNKKLIPNKYIADSSLTDNSHSLGYIHHIIFNNSGLFSNSIHEGALTISTDERISAAYFNDTLSKLEFDDFNKISISDFKLSTTDDKKSIIVVTNKSPLLSIVPTFDGSSLVNNKTIKLLQEVILPLLIILLSVSLVARYVSNNYDLIKRNEKRIKDTERIISSSTAYLNKNKDIEYILKLISPFIERGKNYTAVEEGVTKPSSLDYLNKKKTIDSRRIRNKMSLKKLIDGMNDER